MEDRIPRPPLVAVPTRGSWDVLRLRFGETAIERGPLRRNPSSGVATGITSCDFCCSAWGHLHCKFHVARCGGCEFLLCSVCHSLRSLVETARCFGRRIPHTVRHNVAQQACSLERIMDGEISLQNRRDGGTVCTPADVRARVEASLAADGILPGPELDVEAAGTDTAPVEVRAAREGAASVATLWSQRERSRSR